MGIPRNFPTGTVSVLLIRTTNIVERQAVQWVDGPKKTGGDGTGSDRDMKSAGDGTIVERGTPLLNVQELGQEQQLTLHEHETQEAFSEHEGETQGALSELEEETQEAFSGHEREQQLIKEGEVEPASGSANLEGPALPALRKLTIDGNIPPILSSRTRGRRLHSGVEGEALHCFFAGDRGRRGKRRGGCVGVRRRGADGYAGDAGYTGTEKSAAGNGIAGM